MQSNSGRIIVLEGLDCSFKETNSNLLAEYIRKTENRKVEVVHFPLYGEPSAWFVEQFLAGNFGMNKDLSSGAISTFYMIDMFAYMNQKGKALLESGVDLILDRYWYCNIFYRLGKARLEGEDGFISSIEEETIISTINHLVSQFSLPEPSLLIKMITNKDVMINYVKNKNSKKDIFEADYDYLRAVYDSFISCDLKGYINNDCTYGEVFVIDKDLNVKSKDSILEDVIKIYKKCG